MTPPGTTRRSEGWPSGSRSSGRSTAGGPPPARASPPADAAGSGVAVDARLVPAALASWAVCLVALGLGWGPGAMVTVLALVTAVTAALRLRRPRAGPRLGDTRSGPGSRRAAAIVLAASACAGAVGIGATAGVHAVVAEPLHAAATTGASATVRIVLTGDPVALRSTRPGPARVFVPAELLGVRLARDGGADLRRASGRVVLLAPAESWAGLAPGQEATASGPLGASTRPDLTVAVLRPRGPPAAVGPVPGGQRVAGVLREGLRDSSRAVLDDDPAGLLPGLVVGDTSGLSAGLVEDFRTAGLTHLTAVSGTNVAIVIGAVLLLARLLTCGPRTAALLAVLALVGFVVLARPSPSVLRAATMGAVAVAALALGRGRSVLPALATAVVVLLFVDPALATDAGFALSVLATAALVLAAPALAARLRARGLPIGVAEALAVPVVAHLATAPVIAGLSGTISLVAVVANLFAAPVVAPATVLGVLAALFAPGTDLHADVLKVPHHGSRSSSPAFLTAPAARLALVGVGRGNTYGHPNPGTLAVLARAGTAVRRTDEVGDLAVVVGPDGPTVVSRGDPRPAPRGRR